MTPPPIQVEVSNTSVAWTLELVTPWSACGPAQAHPLLDAEVVAKVRVQTSVLTGAACLSGGVDVSVGGGAAALLPWDATAAAATTTFNALLGASKSEDGVHVERRGDGQSSAVFVVRHLRGGARPALLAVDGAPLLKRSYAADWATHTDDAGGAAVSLEHTAPGGIELLPIPGRYLSAPTNQSTVRPRLQRSQHQPATGRT